MASFEFLAIILTGLGLTASISYYAMVLRNQNKTQLMQIETRRANILMNLHSEWGKNEYQKASWTVMGLTFEDYDDFVNKYGPTTEYSEVNQEIFKVGWFFNGLGSLLHKGFASLDLVDELFGYMVIWLWEIMRPIIVESRTRYNQPESLEWFEYLYNEIQTFRETQN
jgi:hypothetical protein